MPLYKFCSKDAYGNIIAILDSNGKAIVKYIYDAWGNHAIEDNSQTGIGNLNPFRYRSYYYDTETDLYYLKSRYYDPELGRFVSIDSIEYIDPETINGLNLYAYCGNNPVMNVDPNGNKWWNPFSWDWGTILEGVALVVTAVAAVALSVATFGAGTPLAMVMVAGVTLTAGVLTGINGIATIGEGISGGYNFVRDGLFNSVLGLSDNAYNIYAGVVEGVAVVGSMVLGVYQSTGRFKASKAGREYLGKGYKPNGRGGWVSKDGFRQMRLDKGHFNLELMLNQIQNGVRNKTLMNAHLYFKGFKIWSEILGKAWWLF